MSSAAPLHNIAATSKRLSKLPQSGLLLQRKCACGNHTMAGGECAECSKKKRLGLQTKLKVNEPGDAYEQEADRIAEQAMAALAGHAIGGAPPRIQRFVGQPTGQTNAAPASVDQALASPGRLLEPALRQDMEQRFGHDFSQVRVHTGGAAEQSARDVSAHAYTVGQDIVFGTGRFAPGTHEGGKLIAHELTHVVQQTGSVYGQNLSHMGVETEAQAVADGQRTLQRQQDAGAVEIEASTPTQQGSSEQPPINTEAGAGGEAVPPCNPKGLPRVDYLKEPGTSNDDFGLTTLSGTVSLPVVHTSKTAKGLVLDTTDAKLPPLTSVFTAAGTFIEGEAIFIGEGAECQSGKKYPIQWHIFPAGAQKIREGELEHCTDFQHAFAISLRRYADVVNDLAAKKMVFASQRAAENHVTRLVGPKPSIWLDVFTCLARKTKIRDTARWHTPRPLTRPPRLEDSCSFARAFVLASSLPEVDPQKHPTFNLIKGCSEYPAVKAKGGG